MDSKSENEYDADLLNQWLKYSPGEIIDVASVSILQNIVEARVYVNVLHDDQKVSSTPLEATDSKLTAQYLTKQILEKLDEIEKLIQVARQCRAINNTEGLE